MDNVVVIKCGGSTMAELSDSFFENVVEMQREGKQPIIVHGGGPAINEMLEKLAISSVFIDGLRKTTSEVLETAKMVLCGKVNKEVVTKIYKAGGRAVGLSGCDGGLITAKAIDKDKLGYVGDPVAINRELLETLMRMELIPVIAPIGIDEEGVHYNINADSAAGAIAKAMDAKQLVFVTDVDGILKDGECLEQVTAEEVEHYIADGTIYGGMIPKVKAALSTLNETLQSVKIMNGKAEKVVKGTTILR